jgi:hypothetical protein
MNAALTPALIAAGGGSALLSGIWLHEHRRDAAMRRGRVRLSLRFPVGLELAQALAALDGLSGLPLAAELIAEVLASEGSIAHFLWVPAAVRSSVQSILTGVIPSLRVAEAPPAPEDGAAIVSLRLHVLTPSVLAVEGAVAASRALLSGIANLRAGESVALRLALRPGSARPRQEAQDPTAREREIDRAWRRKTSAPGFTTAGLVLIASPQMSRAWELACHVENVLRSRKGLAGGVQVTRRRGNRSLVWLPRTTRTSGWLSTAELLALTGWPLGDGAIPGVAAGTRELLVPRHVPRDGRRLFVGRDGSGERPVALDATAARHHMAVIGPSGVGKSVLLTHAILSDIERGFGGVVIDPKADLIDTILDRVKPEQAERIVVLDPGDTARPTPGVAVLSGGDPDARADVLTGTLKAIFAGAWGVRSDFYGRLAIRTLSEVPGASLADIGRLFYEEPYRRAAVARLRDPFTLSAWQSYEALSEAARAEHVQAPMARVMTLLSRPRVRAVLASPDPKLDVPRLLREKKWLLISLAPGALSEAGATLVGAALMYVVWSAIEARVVLAPERRHPLFIYVDELATLTNGLPFGIELLAERARGLGVGLTVALQTLGRIGEPTRSALVGNLATIISFRAGASEASVLARELPGISAPDLMSLDRFEVVARIGTGSGSAVSVVTGRTLPLPPSTGQAEAIRDRSARAFGARPEPLTQAFSDAAGGDDAGTGVGYRRRS